MPTKKQQTDPSDAATVLSAIQDVLKAHGWGSSSSQQDGDGVVVAAKPLPKADEADEA
jgi:hypothetical protein